MNSKDAEFAVRLQGIFKAEAEEHIRTVTACLLDLENSPSAEKQSETIETVFREVHSLKGSARSVGLKEIESICHPMETVFSSLKRKEVLLAPQMLDLFHRSVDFISLLVLNVETQGTEQNRSLAQELIKQLEIVATVSPEAESISAREPPLESPVRSEAQLHLAETVRIATSKLDPLLYQAEEMILTKLTGTQRTKDLQEINHQLIAWKMESRKWRSRLVAQRNQHFHEFLEWNDSHVNFIQSRVLEISQAMEKDQRNLRRMVDEHLEAMKLVLMLPVSVLTESFPKIVHDLSRDQGKEVGFVLDGGEIEIDKRILEELKEPLIHLLRNCVDHGMKNPRERIARNKPPRGTIQVTFTAIENRHVEILIADDGEGIDLDSVRTAAVKAGVLSSEIAGRLSPGETLSLIYGSGVSTSSLITDVSGRGLGMTIVREKVEKLGGNISEETKPGHGTTFRIVVPLTLATFRGVLVRIRESEFILPSANIERVVRLRPEKIQTVENRETIRLDDQIVVTVKLSTVLEFPLLQPDTASREADSDSRQAPVFIVVMKSGKTRLGFQVDEVLAEHQVLIKSLGKQLSRVRNIAGATVLGTGQVVLVLNVPDLMKSAVRTVDEGITAVAKAKPAIRAGRILAADDSITARTLIKSILENAGYSVKTAVDGVEAFALARSEEFDLIVSDVDMPRMSGFEFASKIRADKKLGQLPIVLVTALDSREDRERGIDAGANAYIVKSSFDQGNLLEVIHKLLG